jgi:hypothetical protein
MLKPNQLLQLKQAKNLDMKLSISKWILLPCEKNKLNINSTYQNFKTLILSYSDSLPLAIRDDLKIGYITAAP